MQEMKFPLQANERRANALQRIKHYRELLWRSKWYLLVSGFILVCASLVVLTVFVSRQHEESTTVIIGVENTADITAVKDVSGLMQAQSDLIMSRTFLKNIVQKLSLQFSMSKFSRASVVDSVSVDSSATPGMYSFATDAKNPDSFTVYFLKDAKEGTSPAAFFMWKKAPAIYKGKASELTGLKGSGVRLVFSKQFRAAPHGFTFGIMDMQHAVEDLYNRTTVKEADSRSGVSNISVSVKGPDFQLIADVANCIADVFVEKSMSFKKARTSGVVASLEKQLETVNKDLSASTDMLRNFRVANPGVGLSENIKQQISGLSQLQNGLFNAKKVLTDAKDLQARYTAASPENRPRIASEILAFLAARNITSASAYQAEMADLMVQARELERTYASDHPIRMENTAKIEKLDGDIFASLKEYASSTENGLATKSSDIQSMFGQLQSLPSKELQLAELERRHQIFSDIYSTVLSRYNQVKVLSAGEVAEAFVMDRAVPPIPPPVSMPKLIALALFAALMLTFLPVFVFDYFDHTAHSETEFVQKTGKHLIEGIPGIKVLRKYGHNGHWSGKNGGHGAHGTPLVVLQNREGISKETFRVLRTKTMLKLNDFPEKSLVITSLEPGAGKSTISANLAYALGQQRIKTLLIDGDLRRGTMHKWFGKNQTPGLSEFLNASDELLQEKIPSLIQATDLPDLFLISAGKPEQASSELLASGRFEHLKKELDKRFTFIIMDSPPLDAVIDSAILAPMFSGFLIVARAGSTNIQELIQRVAEFPIIEDKVLGYVLNKVSSDRANKYYRYKSYYSASPA